VSAKNRQRKLSRAALFFEYSDCMSLDGELGPPVSSLEPPPHAASRRPTLVERVTALLEVVICSDYPTQLALSTTVAALGYQPYGTNGDLSLAYVVLLSLADTVLLLALIAMFLSVHGEGARDLFLGTRPISAEARAGLPLALAALAVGVIMLVMVQQVAPWLHTVPRNPLQDLVRTPRDAVAFAVVAVIAGGVREEFQRAFLLQRFERWLGGSSVGVVVTSISFGLGHKIQGLDAAVATTVLGGFWAFIYLRRRSVVAPVVSHSGFNLLQLAQFLKFGR
jgi:membrane protease YdiL (CAAX protease family)